MSESGSDDDNPFGGDVPDWAVDESNNEDTNEGDDGDNDDSAAFSTTDRSYFGAEHVVILLDCHPSMFRPCLHLRHDDYDDDYDGDGYCNTINEGKGECTNSNNNSDNNKHSQKLFTPMDVALMASYNLLRLRIRHVATMRQGKRDGVGVLLYGCDVHRGKKRMHSEHHGIGNQTMDDDDEYDEDDDMERKQSFHELLPLEPPGTVQSLEIQQCLPVEFLGSGNLRALSNTHVQRDLKREFSIECNDEECEEEYVRKQSMECLRSALHEANKMFMHAKCIKAESPSNKLPDSKSIWIFTNQEDPSYGDEIQRTCIKVAARDALENGVDIHVLPFPKVDVFGNIQCNFNSDILYKSIVSPQYRMENNDCFSQYNDGTVDIEELLDLFDKAMSKVRKIATIPLLLPGWKKRLKEGNDDSRSTEIMLDLYPIVQQKSKGTPISVHQEKNKATIKKTCIVDPNENEVPLERIHHFVEFCGNRVPVRPADVAVLKKMCNSHDKASLILFGFRPTKSFCLEHIIKKSYRAFANDRIVAGSERALFNLKEAMIRKEVYAVGELLLRYSSSSNMVAIFPEKDLAGIVITPIPFKDDMRRVPKEDIGYAERPVVDAAKKLISKSALNDVDFMHDFENPVLKYFFNYLESVSLGRELTDPEKEDGMLRMNVDQMLERASAEIRELSLSLPEDEVPEKKQRGVKRRRKETSNQPQMENTVKDIDEDWIQIYKDDTVAERTNAELKEFLRSIGERIGGKKDDLIDRVHRVIRNYLAKKRTEDTIKI